MARFIILIFLIALNISYISSEYIIESPESAYVTTSNGQIKGRVQNTASGTIFHTFSGIPFAEVPVNELRFQAPVARKPWEGIWDATFERGCCYQMTVDRPEETEDCLYLNVYTPRNDSNNNLAVMVFIYGGAFIEGYSEEVNYGPHHLMDENVILVTLNYRVGPFGFFTTADNAIPGNAGLKDQLLALKWVKENIKSFGGDPEKITIFGESAGAASVIYQVLSPKSKGLFRAAMCESATALSPWAYQHYQKEISYYLMTLLNADFARNKANSSEILLYLRYASAKDIDGVSHSIFLLDSPYNSQIQQGCFFAPILEHEHEGAFITKSMYEKVKSGVFNRVPLLIGLNSEESLAMTDNTTAMEIFTEAFDTVNSLLVPHDLHIISDKNKREVTKLIKDFYLPSGNFSTNPRQLVKYFSDQCFGRSIIKQALLQSNYTDVYLYQFAFHGVLGQLTKKSVDGFSDSVRHGEDLNYFMTRGWGGLNTTDWSKYPLMDHIVAKRMVTFFTNFAKYLNPTPKVVDLFQNLTWPTVKPNDLHYMDIGSHLELRKNLKHEMFQFWENIYSKYAVPPLITY